METVSTKLLKRKRRHQRIRARVRGNTERPRLCVFRSSRHIYAQLVDDRSGRTLAACSSLETDFSAEATVRGSNSAGARRVGEQLAGRALERGIKSVVFDRGGYKYHGRIKALAEGARSQGLLF
jgi:large subunit ribosomal protein L18